MHWMLSSHGKSGGGRQSAHDGCSESLHQRWRDLGEGRFVCICVCACTCVFGYRVWLGSAFVKGGGALVTHQFSPSHTDDIQYMLWQLLKNTHTQTHPPTQTNMHKQIQTHTHKNKRMPVNIWALIEQCLVLWEKKRKKRQGKESRSKVRL